MPSRRRSRILFTFRTLMVIATALCGLLAFGGWIGWEHFAVFLVVVLLFVLGVPL